MLIWIRRLASTRALREAIEEWNTADADSGRADDSEPPTDDTAEQSAELIDAASAADRIALSSDPSHAADEPGEGEAVHGGGAPLPAAAAAALMEEEQRLRERIVAVEDRIGELLRQPLGPDGLGQRQVLVRRPAPFRRLWPAKAHLFIGSSRCRSSAGHEGSAGGERRAAIPA